MDAQKIILQIEGYCQHFEENIESIKRILKDLEILKGLGENILYNRYSRNIRFRLYMLIHSMSKNLVSDKATDYYLFREAYIMTDNIYIQLKQNNLDYNYLTNHLNNFINIKEYMNVDEQDIYDKLNDDLILYRGMSNSEKNSNLYGISWTTDIEMAKRYVFYTKNMNDENIGWVAKNRIKKKDIITIWKGKDQPEEIIINPNIFANQIEFIEMTRS